MTGCIDQRRTNNLRSMRFWHFLSFSTKTKCNKNKSPSGKNTDRSGTKQLRWKDIKTTFVFLSKQYLRNIKPVITEVIYAIMTPPLKDRNLYITLRWNTYFDITNLWSFFTKNNLQCSLFETRWRTSTCFQIMEN